MGPHAREAEPEPVRIPADGRDLDGDLAVPPGAQAVVLFAHGSGSSRKSRRNRFVARQLQQAGLATLLMDLLTPEEEAADARTGHLRFDVEFLAGRLEAATDWLTAHPATAALTVGYFGASTGAAAALIAAANTPERVAAVVSRGGRPDLAGPALGYVRAPTLLLVGGADEPVLTWNREALQLIAAPAKRLVVVPGAGHLFEEPGALEEVARLAAAWFTAYLTRRPRPAPPAGGDLPFANRAAAGQVLARDLRPYAGRDDVLVLALPRGGVPVGYEVAQALGAPLDVFLVRKLGAPGQPELAMGAVATGGVRVLNDEVVDALGVAPEEIDAVTREEWQELRRREREYRDDRPPPDVRGKVVILVDDGLATGASMRAAVAALRKMGPARVVVAVPVAAADTCEALKGEADEVVCARTPEPFRAVGWWYQDFAQTTDAEVRALLSQE